MNTTIKSFLLTSSFLFMISCEQNYQLNTSVPGKNDPVKMLQKFLFIEQQMVTQKKDLDLLFVIDNSGSMQDVLQAFRDSFDAFVNTNLAPSNGITPIDRFCVGLTTTDAYLNQEYTYPDSKEIVRSPYIKGDRKFCSHIGNQRLSNAQIIQKAQAGMDTVGIRGSGAEKAKDSLIKVLDINETSTHKFFKANTFKSIIFISDESEQSSISNTHFIQRVENYFRSLDQLPSHQKPLYHIINVVNQIADSTGHWNHRNWPEFTQALGQNGTMRFIQTDHFNDIFENLTTTIHGTNQMKSSTFQVSQMPLRDSIIVKIKSNSKSTLTLQSHEFSISDKNITVNKDILKSYLNDSSALLEIEYVYYP